jgi:hypothetical protein
MNAALIVLLTNYSRLFVDDPRAAFLLRTSSWKVRHAFDRLSDPVVWWLWIHHFFIPKITGLPFDLPTKFYKKILQHYFSLWHSSWEEELPRWERGRCACIHFVGGVLNSGSCPDQMASHILSYFDCHYVTTAKGRAFFLGVVDEWGECFEDNEKISIALSTVRNFIKYSFQIHSTTMFIRAGWNGRIITNQEREELTWLYDMWRK